MLSGEGPPKQYVGFMASPRSTQRLIVVVVFTLNRYFYPTTSAVPPVSFLILHHREINYVVTDSETEKNQTSLRIKVGKSSASVADARAQQ